MLQQITGCAAEGEFRGARMAVGSHDDHVRAELGGTREQVVALGKVLGGLLAGIRLHPVPGKERDDLGTGGMFVVFGG